MNYIRYTDIVNTPLRLYRIPAGRSIAVLIAASVLLCLFITPNAYPESSAQYKEYEVKAAFMYNFLKFVNWPKEKMDQDANTIIIGIVGDDPFGSAADIFNGKTIEDRQVVVKRFEGAHQLKDMSENDKNKRAEQLRKCHLLFVCASEQKSFQDIINIVSTYGVLTVGDSENFIESGGIVNFFLEDNKIRFDINLDSAEKSGLEMRSQLLRLARKVVKDGQNISPAGADKKKGK
jgi:hypothetical protein